MSFLLWLSCALLAVVLYRLCVHHPRRWRAPRVAGVGAVLLLAVICGLAAQGAGMAVAIFTVLTLMMFWLAVVPLFATFWRRRSGDGA